MKITVIGAGHIGAAVAGHLYAQDEVRLVQVCDSRARALQQLNDRYQDPKLRSFQVDARDHHVLDSILRGCDCVIAAAAPHMNPGLAALCVEMGIHYLDLGGSGELVEQVLALDEQARAKSVWVVPNCGLAPGLANVLCMEGIEQFDEVEAARLRVGDVPQHPEPPFNFRLTWSADKILDDYTEPVQLIEEGEVREFPSLSRVETIDFGAPYAPMEAFCTAGGLSTLAQQLAGRVRTLDHKTIRWPGHAEQMQFIIGLGFADDRTIDVRTHLTYRDVLARRLRKCLGGHVADAVLLRVLIQGRKEGRERTLVYEMIDRSGDDRRLSAIERCTSVPAAVAAMFVASGRIPGGGAAPPDEALPKDQFCEMVRAYGLPIETTWYDGYVDVRAPGRSADAT